MNYIVDDLHQQYSCNRISNLITLKKNKLGRKLDEYNHTMELIRTILPIILLIT